MYLGPIDFKLRHVEVVHKNDGALAHRRAVDALEKNTQMAVASVEGALQLLSLCAGT